MDKSQEQYFKSLSADRFDSAKTLEKPSMRGVKNSVVEKYSDQAHFIYELLQNADDARATSARFVLYKDKLVFSHNGLRRFSVSDPNNEDVDGSDGKLGDVNAITSIANSNKTEASIGKFGVGFKAVFQYTATPHIYDPDIFFKIERFIDPKRVSEDYPGRKAEETLFFFPFDHDKRSPEEAYADISEKLRTLDYPLLFLSNLKDIYFEIDGIHGLYGKTVEETSKFDDVKAEFVRLTQNDGENHYERCDNLLWLFSRDDEKNLTYSVGFFVNADAHLVAPSAHTAFCFFPTKEVTGLNFIVHAPFLLTDSREGIRAGVQHNIDMIDLLSELAAESLVCLRDIGQSKKTPLIGDDIFDIVPHDESKFTNVDIKKAISFKPFYMAMKKAFETKSIIPNFGGYVSKRDAYWASVPQIAELFSNEQLASLTKNDTAKWVFASFGMEETRRQKKYLADYINL
jgi:hypothetical protein